MGEQQAVLQPVMNLLATHRLVILDRSTFSRIKRGKFKSSEFAVVKNMSQAKQIDALFTYIRKSGALFYNENRDKSGFGQGSQFADTSERAESQR